MESKMTPQLEEASLAADMELSPSSPPLPPDSHPLPSFNSLPPELLIHIFESIPYHPHNQRVADLARVCLVNHRFLEIARPLLYHQVHLDFLDDYDTSWSGVRRLSETLLEFDYCAELVKTVRISMETPSNLQVTTLAYLVSQLKALESIRMTGIKESDDEDFIRAVYKHQVGLKHLDVRDVNLDQFKYRWRMLRALRGLVTLVGRFKPWPGLNSASYQHKLSCRLHRFVSTSSIATSTFKCILYSSSFSLTSLAFGVDPEHAKFNLERFKKLRCLRITIEDDVFMTLNPFGYHPNRPDQSRDMREAQISEFAIRIRRILGSTLSPPLETLSITVREDCVAGAMSSYPILKLLPPSLRHFGTVFEFIDPFDVNHRHLAAALRRGRLPHLSKITVFPSNDYSESYRLPPSAPAQERFGEVEKKFGIPVTWHQSSPGLITQWYTLEPYLEETDREEEDGESEEDYGSEEEDEFRSDYEEDEDGSEGSEGSDDE